MKQYNLTIIFVLCLLSYSFGQQAVKKADKHVARLQHKMAIPLYEYALEKDTTVHILKSLGDCYFAINSYQEANTYYTLLSNIFPQEKRHFIEYGMVLKNLGEYTRAKVLFKRHLESNIDSKRIKDILNLIKSCERIEKLKENTNFNYVSKLSVNGKYNDFSPIMFENYLMFCSSRRSTASRTYQYDGESYINFYVAERKGDTIYNEPLLFEELNGRFHEGPAVFSKRYQTMFLTRNNMTYKGRKNEHTNRLKIYFSNLRDEEFEEPKEFQHNSEDYSTGHPAINPKGNVFIFTSDRPGGKGKTDLYKCMLTKQGWSNPVNMGDKINTSGREMFPFIYNDTLLYFASDRHEGLGGLDIFQAVIKNGRVLKIENLQAPINSNKDDFGFFLEDLRSFKGYFSSNRDTVANSDDIYLVKRAFININCLVIDSLTYDAIPFSDVKVTAKSGIAKASYTNREGKAKLDMAPEEDFILTFHKKGYKPKRLPFSTIGLSKQLDTSIVVELVPGKEYMLDVVVINKKTKEVIPEAKVELEQSDYKEIIDTDEKGELSFSTENTSPVKLVTSKKGFFKSRKTIPEITEDKKVVVELVPIEQKMVLSLEPIYYDFDRYEIREDAAKTLDKLKNIMDENPSLIIEMASHTDIRGTTDYNHELSVNRAKAAIKYLMSKGIDRFRLTYNVYGESKVAAPCPEGEDCDDNVHQLNRRTEFKVANY